MVEEPGFIIHIADNFSGELNIVVCELSNLGVVDTLKLSLPVDTQAQSGNKVHEEKDKACDGERVQASADRVSKLITHLCPVMLNPSTLDARITVESSDSRTGEEGGANIADETANTVDGENIEGIVDSEKEFDLGSLPKEGHSLRGDADKTSNDTGTEPNSGELPLEAVVQKTPASIEAKPPDPEEDGSSHDMSSIVWAVVELMGSVTTALAQHHGVGQSSTSRSNVHRGTSGKVQATHLVGPAIRVPSPTCDGVVDDSGPHEDEDDAGEHPATLGDGSGSESYGQGREHALIHGKHHVREMRRAHRRTSQDIAEAKVGQVTDEGTCRM
ncbi:hypothetical protein HG531_002150 [Fusarium graminearum]|nr:hypothetical protein HG531_002150 [Fusarium graminearum]